MQTQSFTATEPFLQKYNGKFYNMLRWEQLDALWQTVRALDKSWYIYAIGEEPPTETVTTPKLYEFLQKMSELLREEHGESYCGIVYCDDKTDPEFVKIYDPNNLGSVCGSSGHPPPLPGWIISTCQPVNLEQAFPPPNNRRRWWKKLFAS